MAGSGVRLWDKEARGPADRQSPTQAWPQTPELHSHREEATCVGWEGELTKITAPMFQLLGTLGN